MEERCTNYEYFSSFENSFFFSVVPCVFRRLNSRVVKFAGAEKCGKSVQCCAVCLTVCCVYPVEMTMIDWLPLITDVDAGTFLRLSIVFLMSYPRIVEGVGGGAI